ncbi:MAG TPA: glycosyltransferase family 2 protein [Patescibacteria group bacterium]|nr:glycosyltransferase family 2 protein [Patescibacteria group bacterium]
MKTSVIIPTYNEKKDLEDCIESLGDQTYGDFEIIVVDDGSSDATVEILQNLEKTLPNFKFAEQEHNGAGAARNKGAGIAKGEILVFVDADMTFDKEFIKKLVEPIEKGKAKGTFSKEEYVGNWDNVWARCWNLNEGWEDKRRHPKNYPDTQPVFRAILASEFNRVKGFTPGGYDDDWSLSKKLGYNAIFAPGAVFYHKNPSSLGEIFNHAKWVGKRHYKLGIIGNLVALIRSSFPVSILVGLIKSILTFSPAFLLFKIVYDAGIFIGILEFTATGRKSK